MDYKSIGVEKFQCCTAYRICKTKFQSKSVAGRGCFTNQSVVHQSINRSPTSSINHSRKENFTAGTGSGGTHSNVVLIPRSGVKKLSVLLQLIECSSVMHCIGRGRRSCQNQVKEAFCILSSCCMKLDCVFVWSFHTATAPLGQKVREKSIVM